jgi:tetratricopeptide (TPR) repeat protein
MPSTLAAILPANLEVAMRFVSMVLALMFVAVPASMTAQLSDAELMRRVAAAEDGSPPGVLLQGAAAARLLGDFETAERLLENAQQSVGQAENALINEMILHAMASGAGANGMQRAFREARQRIRLTPQQIAGFANNYPTLLTGGEFDEMILRLSPEAANPEYRCACLAQKAWVHRVAGRLDESQKLWAELVAEWDRNPPQFNNPNAHAQWQGQYARNLARAGRMADARAELEKGMAMPVSDAARPAVQRRWAQAFAELGDVEGAVAQLESLLESSTLVTVASLTTRYAWEPVRNDPAFQAMLDRHR